MPGKIKTWYRSIRNDLAKTIEKRQSCFLLGPRQVGKTTLILDLLADRPDVLNLPLQDPNLRLAYEKDPGLLVRQITASKKILTVYIDEVQKVRELLDAVQLLIDEGKANFILTGSSARKLRKAGTNLLPGRVKSFHLDPLNWSELGWLEDARLDELSIAKHSFIAGRSVTGWPKITVRRGEVVWEGRQIKSQPGSGKLIPRHKSEKAWSGAPAKTTSSAK